MAGRSFEGDLDDLLEEMPPGLVGAERSERALQVYFQDYPECECFLDLPDELFASYPECGTSARFYMGGNKRRVEVRPGSLKDMLDSLRKEARWTQCSTPGHSSDEDGGTDSDRTSDCDRSSGADSDSDSDVDSTVLDQAVQPTSEELHADVRRVREQFGIDALSIDLYQEKLGRVDVYLHLPWDRVATEGRLTVHIRLSRTDCRPRDVLCQGGVTAAALQVRNIANAWIESHFGVRRVLVPGEGAVLPVSRAPEVDALMQMGFEERHARWALRQHPDDVAAAALLLTEADGADGLTQAMQASTDDSAAAPGPYPLTTARVGSEGSGGFLALLMEYLLDRLPDSNRYCVVCDNRHTTDVRGPTPCALCVELFQYQTLERNVHPTLEPEWQLRRAIRVDEDLGRKLILDATLATRVDTFPLCEEYRRAVITAEMYRVLHGSTRSLTVAEERRAWRLLSSRLRVELLPLEAMEQRRQIADSAVRRLAQLARAAAAGPTAFPPHWTVPSRVEAGPTPLQRSYCHPVSADEFAALKAGLSTRNEWVGHGSDVRRSCDGVCRGLVLHHAWRVQNEDLWLRYSAARDGVAEAVRNGRLPCCSVSIRREVSDALGPQGEALLEPLCCDEGVNESRLFHGTRVSRLQGILQSGLDERFCRWGRFGSGVYLADDIGKADQYTDSGELPSSDVASMLYDGAPAPPRLAYVLVCRVVLGCPARTRDGNLLCSPRRGRPWADSKTLATVGDHGERYTSLIVEPGDVVWRYREFVLPDGQLIYPEYLLAYTRA